MLTRANQDTLTPEQSGKALRLLKAIGPAGPSATFEDRRAILRWLDMQLLYNGEVLQPVGTVPARGIPLQEILRATSNDGISSPRPQSLRIVGSLPGAKDSSTFPRRKRNKDCTRD